MTATDHLYPWEVRFPDGTVIPFASPGQAYEAVESMYVKLAYCEIWEQQSVTGVWRLQQKILGRAEA